MKILWGKMRLQRILNERTEEEELEQMWEMATIRKQDSGLPANIFVDNSMSYRRGRHAMRIKFQPNRGDAAFMIPGGKAASSSEKERLHRDLAALLRGGKR